MPEANFLRQKYVKKITGPADCRYVSGRTGHRETVQDSVYVPCEGWGFYSAG